MSQHFIGDTHLTKEEIARLAVDGLRLQMEQLSDRLSKVEALLGKGTATVNGLDPKPKKKAKWSAEQREAAALRMKRMWAEKRKNERARKFKKTA
jgi:hypothetical protein